MRPSILLAACLLGSCGEDGPELHGGSYQVLVTNLEDACVLPGWIEGDTFEGRWDVSVGEFDVYIDPRWSGGEPPWGFPLTIEGYRDDSRDHFAVSILTSCEACPCNDSVDFTMDGYAWSDGSLRGVITYNVSREDSACAPLFVCQAVQRFTAD